MGAIRLISVLDGIISFQPTISKTKADSKRWHHCWEPSFFSRWQSRAVSRPSLSELRAIVVSRMTISSYEILNARRTSHNATILTALRLQDAGVIAKTYKARVLTSTSQDMAAFKSVMFDDRQV